MIGAKEQTLWMRRFHDAPRPRARLVCFPHAGGSASFYFPMSAALAPTIDVLAVQYPGRQDRLREPCVEDVPTLARYVHDVLPPDDGVPTALFGHSMGAIVAYEVARLMEPSRPPARVFVSGRRAPSVHRDERRHLLDDEALIADLRTLDGTDRRVFADEDLLRMSLPAIRGDYRASETYTPTGTSPLSCPITALTGDADPRASVDDVRGWATHTTGPFHLSVHPGGHFFLVAERQAVLTLVVQQTVEAI